MVAIFPIRVFEGKLEFLFIKRATKAYNWQWVTGGVHDGETPDEAAHRELYEETGYSTTRLIPYSPPEGYLIDDEKDGDRDAFLLKLYVEQVEGIHYVAIIEEDQDPVLSAEEHTDWQWCEYQTGYELIKWSIEKKGFRLLYEDFVAERIDLGCPENIMTKLLGWINK